MKKVFLVFALGILSVALTASAFAQLKNRTTAKKKNPSQTATATPTPQPADKNETANQTDAKAGDDFSTPKEPQKKNQNLRTQNRPAKPEIKVEEGKNLYTYEFSQPDFVVKHITIKHNENGQGTITFVKRVYDSDPFTDPVEISAASLEKIKSLFQKLNFLDSTEDYQSPIRQYPHLGNMKIRLKQDGRERTTEFNWSENADAKALADEYKKISEQYIWLFDISVSLQNQPLEAPGLMDKLDTLLRINQISDPMQLVPVLKKLSNDERIPLIARNHAVRIAKDIEKKNGK